MDYPKHLSGKIREEVAVNYLKHELKKIFPSINNEEISSILERGCGLSFPRDFWNGVHGIGMGFKLHIGLIYLLTAENIMWTKEKLNIEDLYFGTERKNTETIGSKSIKKLIEFYKEHPEEKSAAKKNLIDGWVQVNNSELDPIIVNDKNEGLAVYEGHNRVEKIMLDDKKIVEAYVGRYTTKIKRPQNYWLPTSLLMDNLFYVYQAIENEDEELFAAQIKVLKNMLQYSESGKIEFRERALTSKPEIREKIITALELR